MVRSDGSGPCQSNFDSSSKAEVSQPLWNSVLMWNHFHCMFVFFLYIQLEFHLLHLVTVIIVNETKVKPAITLIYQWFGQQY